MTKPILFGDVYRPQKVYIIGDTNYNLFDRKMNLILKKGYRYSNDLTNYTTLNKPSV